MINYDHIKVIHCFLVEDWRVQVDFSFLNLVQNYTLFNFDPQSP